MIRVLNVQQDKVQGGGIRQFLSRKGDQNSLGMIVLHPLRGIQTTSGLLKKDNGAENQSL